MFFLTGVAFAGVVEALVAGLAVDLDGFAVVLVGVGPVPVFTALAGLEAGVTAFLVAVPVVVVGLEALLTVVFPVVVAGVFLMGVAAGFDGVVVVVAVVPAAPGVLRTGSFFCVPSGVLGLTAGVAPLVATGVPAALSFLGTFFTGVAAELTVLVAVLVAFFTGGIGVVLDAADCVVFTGVEAAVFFAAGWLLAVLAKLLTLATRTYEL
jgi:hypothetical protein